MRTRTRLGALAIGALSTLMITGPASALGPQLVDPIPRVIPHGNVTVDLKSVASGFVNAVTATFAPGDKDHLYIGEQRGKIWSLSLDGDHDGRGGSSPRLVADLGAIIVPLGCFGLNYDERGLFGIAFHPDFRHNGLVYTYTNQTPTGQTPLPPNQCNSRQPHDHDDVVTEWRVTKPGSNRATVDPASARELLRVDHPQFNHNGGEVRFGRDGMLYISIGDGGNADDQGPGHAPGGNAQDLTTLKGKILRIDPMAGSRAPGYAIPKDNPFASAGGGVRPEIWAYGFRNPYKMSFDRKTGDLYVADVGQNDVEEIDVVTAGKNYGWPVKEGTFAFDMNGDDPGFVTGDTVTGNFVDPIAQYDHCQGPATARPCPGAEGVAIVGGFVYRGDEIEALRGHYVFGDYSTNFFASTGRLFYLDDNHQVVELNLPGGAAYDHGLLGIGEDAEGELYVLGKKGAAFPNTGIVDNANTSSEAQRVVGVDDDHGDHRDHHGD